MASARGIQGQASRRLAPLKVATFIDFCEEICRPHDARAIGKIRLKKDIEVAPKV